MDNLVKSSLQEDESVPIICGSSPSKLDVENVNVTEEIDQAYIMDESVAPRMIGEYVASLQPTSNCDIMDMLPALTSNIPSLDAFDSMVTNISDPNVRSTLVGLTVMVNRLMDDNRNLIRELAAIKSELGSNSVTRMGNCEFSKQLIKGSYTFKGNGSIPRCDLMPIVAKFEMPPNRRGESSLQCVRRFVRFLLANIIPTKYHSKYTLRERGGRTYLTPLPSDLFSLIKDMCLEALNLSEPQTDEDRIRQADFINYVRQEVKFALLELRRTPRKSRTSN